MKLGDLANGEFELDGAAAGIEITGITADSREVKRGFLFAALAGEKVDGKSFIPQAIANGAAAVLAQGISKSDGEAAFLTHPNPRLALARLAARFHPGQPPTMAAVTGTAGKTSVASFLRQIWEQTGCAAASIGTTGVVAPGLDVYGNLTTPDPVALHELLHDLAGRGVTHASMEASSHGLKQHRLDGVRLAGGAFTNLGRDHLDYHPDMEDYFEAKMRLFRDLLPKDAPAVVFADDKWAERVIAVAVEAGLDPVTVGRKGKALSLKRLEHERFRQIAEIHAGNDIYRVEFPLAGDFQIANGLVAAGLAIATGSETAQVMKALEHLKGASGRLEHIANAASGAPIYVDYAHKPEALENVLHSLRPFTANRLIVVFGCGGDRDPGKRPIMGDIAARLADVVIVTDDNPRSEDPAAIRAAIRAACPEATEIGDRRAAIEKAVAMLQAGDTLVIAGKGHEEGQTIAGKTFPFSDASVIRETVGMAA